MANRTFDNVQALNKEVKVISGQVQIDGTDDGSAPWDTLQGIGFTAGSTGTIGELKISLQDNYVGLLSVSGNSLQTDAAARQSVLSEDVLSTSDPQLTLQNIDGTHAKVAFADDDIVFFTLVLRNSTVQ